MQSWVFITVRRLSIGLSDGLTAATASGGFAAECQHLQQILIVNCGQHAACTGTQQYEG